GSARPRGASTRTWSKAYAAAARANPQVRLEASPIGLLPGAGCHQLLGPLLETLVQGLDGLERVDLVDRLVRPEVRDPRNAQRVAGLVALRADDDVERDLDDDCGLDLPIPSEALDRVGFEPRGHLRDLGI